VGKITSVLKHNSVIVVAFIVWCNGPRVFSALKSGLGSRILLGQIYSPKVTDGQNCQKKGNGNPDGH